MWKTFTDSLNEDFRFFPPAEEHKITRAESLLNITFPTELSDFLAETNGLHCAKSYTSMVWSIEDIEQTNLEFRKNINFAKLYMPFESLLFFGDAGNGDQFAFRILSGEVSMSDVYVWDHENDSRIWIAPSLKTFIEWWSAGKIKI
jgi:hypothetical protein